MKLRSTIVMPLLAIGLALLAGACSSNSPSNDGSKGSLAVTMGATRAPAAGVQAATTDHEGDGDALSHFKAATMTISSVEARNTDGTWVVIDTGLPATVDLLALLTAGNSVTLPADLVPEGQYNAIQIVITKVDLTLQDDTQISITPPGAGWTVQIPVDFSVVAGQATTVNLNLRCDNSFHLINGEFEFDPEIDVEGVEHDDSMHH
jgi:hypothetical protein